MDKMKSLFFSSLLTVVATSGLAQNPIRLRWYIMIKYIFILPMMRIIPPGLR